MADCHFLECSLIFFFQFLQTPCCDPMKCEGDWCTNKEDVRETGVPTNRMLTQKNFNWKKVKKEIKSEKNTLALFYLNQRISQRFTIPLAYHLTCPKGVH